MQKIPAKIKNYLLSDLEVRKQANPRYSLRAYAKHLGIASSLLSRILKGRVPITHRMLVRLSEEMAIPPKLFHEFAQEIQECETTRKKVLRQQSSKRISPEEKALKIESASFTIQCRQDMVPHLNARIQTFQKALAEFVTQNGGQSTPECELRISIQFTNKS